MVPAKKRSRFDRAAANPGDTIGGVRKPSIQSELILERELKTAAQFRCGLSCKSDSRHVLDLIRTDRNARSHPPRHLVGFS